MCYLWGFRLMLKLCKIWKYYIPQLQNAIAKRCWTFFLIYLCRYKEQFFLEKEVEFCGLKCVIRLKVSINEPRKVISLFVRFEQESSITDDWQESKHVSPDNMKCSQFDLKAWDFLRFNLSQRKAWTLSFQFQKENKITAS